MFEDLILVLIILTSVLVAALVAIGFLFHFKAKEKLPAFFNFAFGTAAGYALSGGTVMLFMTIWQMKEDGEFFPELFWPLFVFLILMLVLLAAATVIKTFKKEWFKPFMIAALVAVFIYMLCLVFAGGLKEYMYETFSSGDDAGLIISALILLAVIVVLPLVFGKKIDAQYETRAVVFAALCIALSFALSYLKLFEMPQGGSITYASLLPLMVYAYIFGMRRGVVAGFTYGILQAIQDPWILHPVQFLLDYPLAFAMIGLAGLFKEINLFKGVKGHALIQFILGGVFAVVLRYACHVISGIIVFDIYAPEGTDPVAWGFLYNTFAFVDMLIALVAGASLFASKSFKAMLPTILPVSKDKTNEIK